MICYEVPLSTYPATYNKKPLMFAALAAQRNNISLYLTSGYQDPALLKALQAEFAKIGKKPNMGKSCVKFKNVDDIPVDAIGKMINKITLKKFIQSYEGVKGKK